MTETTTIIKERAKAINEAVIILQNNINNQISDFEELNKGALLLLQINSDNKLSINTAFDLNMLKR